MWLSEKESRKSPISKKVLSYKTESVHSRFNLCNELGSGFSGVVRLCVDRQNGQRLACKSISKASLKQEADIDDIRLEIAVMKRLNQHSQLVTLREVFEDGSHVHLIMELCEGGDLFDEVVKCGPVGEPGAASIIYQMAEALSFCHGKGVMHRDIKPENILLLRRTQRDRAAKLSERDGSMFQVKLGDFGLALFLGPFQEASGFAGSPYYVAPEVLSQTWYGKEADIWSLGVVLYVILSGEFPFAGDSDAKLYSNIKRGKLNFSYPPWPSISALAKSLIKSMLSLDPRTRPTAQQILQHPWIQATCCPPAAKEFQRDGNTAFVPPHMLHFLTNGDQNEKEEKKSDSPMGLPQIKVDISALTAAPAPTPGNKNKPNFFLEEVATHQLSSPTKSGATSDSESPKSVLRGPMSETSSEDTYSDPGSPLPHISIQSTNISGSPLAELATLEGEDSAWRLGSFLCAYCDTMTAVSKYCGGVLMGTLVSKKANGDQPQSEGQVSSV